MTGIVKAVRTDRGFGFIEAVGLPDIYFHHLDLSPLVPFADSLVNRKVYFEVVMVERGYRAYFVRAAA